MGPGSPMWCFGGGGPMGPGSDFVVRVDPESPTSGDFPLALLDLKFTSQWTSQGVPGPIGLPAIPCKQTIALVANHQYFIGIVLHACSLGFWEHLPLFSMKDCQIKVERMHIYYVLKPTSVQQWASHGPPFETISQFHLKLRCFENFSVPWECY